MQFSADLLYSLGVEGAQDVQTLFRNIYNAIAQQLCDPFYRTILKAQLVSIDQESEGSIFVELEFVVDATCRGTNCTDLKCIFGDETDSDNCGRGGEDEDVSTRNRKLKKHATPRTRTTKKPLPAVASGYSTGKIQYRTSVTDVHNLRSTTHEKEEGHMPRRNLQTEEDQEEDKEVERCFCWKGRSVRPPSLIEFRKAFQVGLDRITDQNKLSSCQQCSFDMDCKSGICLAGRCAEADTQLLSNSCACSSEETCESGLCGGLVEGATIVPDAEDGSQPTMTTGTCQGKLVSCRICDDGDECLSGQCTAGRCAETKDSKLITGCDCTSNLDCQSGWCVDDYSTIGTSRSCANKISNTCTEPCLLSTDCVSGLCGSIVCIPALNGTLLPDGCLSTLSSECESGVLENNVCSTRNTPPPTSGPAFPLSHLPSTSPSIPPSPEPSSGPTFPPSSGPTFSPSSGPTFPPTQLPSTSPSTSPSFPPSTQPSPGPTMLPSIQPSTLPTLSPTFSPSTSPSSTPSTSLPTISPSLSPSTTQPSTSPSTPPSTPPSSAPSTSFPSALPSTSAPTTSPTALEDCRTFPANGFTMVDVENFCNAHAAGEECCTGPQACDGWKLDSTFTICKSACRGKDVCANIQPPEGSNIFIGVGSCKFASGPSYNPSNPINSCSGISGTTVSIGMGSCIGAQTCQGMNFKNIYVADNSCTGNYACYNMSPGTDTLSIGFPIGDSQSPPKAACVSPFSCQEIRAFNQGAPGAILIGPGACDGTSACFRIAAQGGGAITIHENSCVSGSACYWLGELLRPGFGSIEVKENSCTAGYACREFGWVAKSILIGGLSCTTENSCRRCGRASFGSSITCDIVIAPETDLCPVLPDSPDPALICPSA